MKSFYVLNWDFNKDRPEYIDVIPFFVQEYKEREEHLTTYDEFKDWVRQIGHWHYWGRCQYEIIVTGWPQQKYHAKIDVWQQLEPNIDIVTKIVMENV